MFCRHITPKCLATDTGQLGLLGGEQDAIDDTRPTEPREDDTGIAGRTPTQPRGTGDTPSTGRTRTVGGEGSDTGTQPPPDTGTDGTGAVGRGAGTDAPGTGGEVVQAPGDAGRASDVASRGTPTRRTRYR